MAKATRRKIKDNGRPPGSPNKKTDYLRDEVCTQFRCAEGFNQTIKALQRELGGSKSDILHDALQAYAFKKLQDPADILWVNKIQ